MRYLAAQSASRAAIENRRHWIFSQWILVGLDSERRASRQANAGMIAGAGIGINAEPFANHALPFLGHICHQRLYAALFVESAFALRDDHFGTTLFCGECFDEGVAHFRNVVSACDRAY